MEAKSAPAANLFQFPPEIGFYRLFYKADQSEIIALSPTRAGLPTSADPCERPGGATCFAIPRGVGVNPYMRIEVNGSRDHRADRRHGPRRDPRRRSSARTMSCRLSPSPNPSTAVQSPLNSTAGKQDILELVLTGDEQVRWEQ